MADVRRFSESIGTRHHAAVVQASGSAWQQSRQIQVHCLGIAKTWGIRGIKGASPYPCVFQLIPHVFFRGIRGISGTSVQRIDLGIVKVWGYRGYKGHTPYPCGFQL